MTRILDWLTVILLLASIVLQNPLLFLLAVLLALVAFITALWGRYALAGVTYARRLGAPRMFVGEETELEIEITNAKPLPLAWLRALDEFPAEMELVKGKIFRTHKENRRHLVNLVSLRFYERVRKHYRLRAKHRGALEFGPVEISSGDMFGFKTQQRFVPQTDLLIVYPKVVPIAALGLPAAHPFGEAKTTRRIAQDPLRMMSVREYIPGDSPRLIHWKATARRAANQSIRSKRGACLSDFPRSEHCVGRVLGLRARVRRTRNDNCGIRGAVPARRARGGRLVCKQFAAQRRRPRALSALAPSHALVGDSRHARLAD